MRYFEKITNNVIKNHNTEIDDFIDYLHNSLIPEGIERLTPTILNLTCDISPIGPILYEKSKEINNEIVELIKLMPYGGDQFDILFFTEYNFLIYNFLNNNSYFNLNYVSWYFCEDLQHLLKNITVLFLTMIRINTVMYHFGEENEKLQKDTIEIIKLFNKSVDLLPYDAYKYDFPKGFDRKYYFLQGEHFDYFLEHRLPTLIKLLSYTTSLIYISKLSKAQANKKDIIHAFLNELDMQPYSKLTTKSYNWISKKDIKQLFNILRDKDLLIYGTTFTNFQKAFNGTIIKENYNKIKFNTLKDSQVLYLITNLMDYNFISKESNFSWKRFYALFEIKSKETSLRSSLKILDTKLSKSNKDIIKDVIKNLQ